MHDGAGGTQNRTGMTRRLARAGRFLWLASHGRGLTLALVILLVATAISRSSAVAHDASPYAAPAGMSPAALPLDMAIDHLIPDAGGVYGVLVIDPGRNVVYSHNPTVPFISASLYKLPLMAHIYALVEQGALRLTDGIFMQDIFWSEGEDSYYDWSWMGTMTTVEEALFAAGAYSSNAAAWALATLTTWPEVEATARAIGMVDTHLYIDPAALPAWPPMPGPGDSAEDLAEAVAFIDSAGFWGAAMLTTPRDIATFFSGLLAGRVISVEASWAMLDILSRQVVNDRFPWLLPEQTWIAHKTGNLAGVLHDAGIIYTGAGPVIVVGMAQAASDEWLAISALQQLAWAVFQTYQA
jgi:beta-lactamase class A